MRRTDKIIQEIQVLLYEKDHIIEDKDEQIEEMQTLLNKQDEIIRKLKSQTSSFSEVVCSNKPKNKKEKLCQCSLCKEKLPAEDIFYYVDGNNISITKNSPPYCKKCYIKTYGYGR